MPLFTSLLNCVNLWVIILDVWSNKLRRYLHYIFASHLGDIYFIWCFFFSILVHIISLYIYYFVQCLFYVMFFSTLFDIITFNIFQTFEWVIILGVWSNKLRRSLHYTPATRGAVYGTVKCPVEGAGPLTGSWEGKTEPKMPCQQIWKHSREEITRTWKNNPGTCKKNGR